MPSRQFNYNFEENKQMKKKKNWKYSKLLGSGCATKWIPRGHFACVITAAILRSSSTLFCCYLKTRKLLIYSFLKMKSSLARKHRELFFKRVCVRLCPSSDLCFFPFSLYLEWPFSIFFFSLADVCILFDVIFFVREFGVFHLIHPPHWRLLIKAM